MYVHICVCPCVCIPVYRSTEFMYVHCLRHVCVHCQMCVHMYTDCVHVCVCLWPCAHVCSVHVYECSCACVCMHMPVHACVWARRSHPVGSHFRQLRGIILKAHSPARPPVVPERRLNSTPWHSRSPARPHCPSPTSPLGVLSQQLLFSPHWSDPSSCLCYSLPR